MNDYERRVLENIERVGCHVTSVFDRDGSSPPFSYSVGIARTCGAPELIVVGVPSDLGGPLVNAYHDRVAAGERFAPMARDAGFLEGYDVIFVPVSREARAQYMLSACWLHDGPDFAALQMVWPHDDGTWPWDVNAADAFRAKQPLLNEDAPCSSP